MMSLFATDCGSLPRDEVTTQFPRTGRISGSKQVTKDAFVYYTDDDWNSIGLAKQYGTCPRMQQVSRPGLHQT